MYVSIVIFVIIIIIIIIATFIISIKFFFWSYAQNVVFDVKKRGPSCPNWGQGGGYLGDSGNARKKTFFSVDVFP